MNVLFDNIIFSLQESGGISVVWYELIRRAIVDKNIKASFIEYPNTNILKKGLSIPKELVKRSSFKFIPVSVQRYSNPKIKNSTGIFHSSYYRTAASSNVANITTIHDFTYEYYRKGLAKCLHSWQKGKAIKNSAGIICVSENTKKDLLKFYPQVNEQNVYVVYNGVSEAYRQIKKEQYQNKLVHFCSGEYAIYVGDRSSSYKNFLLAANSCKATGTSLVIVGGGPLSKTESSFLDNSLGKNNYKNLSGIDNESLNFLYNNALCLLYPSLYEGFGIPVIEAQKAGCPVIAVNVSSIPEVIGPVSTLLDKPTVENIAEMMLQLKKNSHFTNEQIEIGLKNSSRFSWDKCYQGTKKIYKQLYEEYF